MKFCDLLCKYAKAVGSENDGAGCRIYQAVFCKKKNRTVFKNTSCGEKEIKK